MSPLASSSWAEEGKSEKLSLRVRRQVRAVLWHDVARALDVARSLDIFLPITPA